MTRLIAWMFLVVAIGCEVVIGGSRAVGPVCAAGGCVSAASSAASPRVKNPYEGASFYVNPEYVPDVNESMAKAPALKAAMEKVRAQPTAVWLDRIATIEGSPRRMGIEAHLDEALAQQARSTQPQKPMLVTFVIYNLPDRDCASFAFNGELTLKAGGLAKFKTDYIDEIVKLLNKNPSYKRLRIVIVVEPDSIPNAITNVNHDYPKGIVIDTSRNGWRATAEGSPIERRVHRGNRCNVSGAGIGERPRASPAPGVDAPALKRAVGSLMSERSAGAAFRANRI